jgi:hypothetical protein
MRRGSSCTKYGERTKRILLPGWEALARIRTKNDPFSAGVVFGFDALNNQHAQDGQQPERGSIIYAAQKDY